jgi:hypothetical protein
MDQTDAGTAFLHDTCTLVAGYHWHNATPFTAKEVHVAMADGGRGHTHLDLASLWRIDLNLFYYQGLAKLITYCRLHFSTSTVRIVVGPDSSAGPL